MGQGQPMVIIWMTLIVLPYTMLHAKFQGHRSIGSGGGDFLRFLPYMGMTAMLVMWPRPFEHLFFPKVPGGCIWNLVAIGPVVTEEKSFEIADRRTTEPAYTISSPGAFGSGELKKKEKQFEWFISWCISFEDLDKIQSYIKPLIIVCINIVYIRLTSWTKRKELTSNTCVLTMAVPTSISDCSSKYKNPVHHMRRGNKDLGTIIQFFSTMACVVTRHLNCLVETVLMIGHIICFHIKRICDPSLKPSLRDNFYERSQHMFSSKIRKIISILSRNPILSGALEIL